MSPAGGQHGSQAAGGPVPRGQPGSRGRAIRAAAGGSCPRPAGAQHAAVDGAVHRPAQPPAQGASAHASNAVGSRLQRVQLHEGASVCAEGVRCALGKACCAGWECGWRQAGVSIGCPGGCEVGAVRAWRELLVGEW